MEKRDNLNQIFVQSPGRRYLAMQGKLLRRATTSVNGRIPPIEQEKKGVA